ncbi:TonB-dependent receptor [Sphingomonas colocasiae]|uniref:TonB-dependent receptor n=1 Tax=Sphingomonas colocasiae TaxID=1848973 RepID=A0ABS7PXX1_9SPHN|nr:TonB-dependent receptor [Sphingomonas colocasiae]MBY8825510.1 TonB-dependent receptor [Sphingomonas colocasiae]
MMTDYMGHYRANLIRAALAASVALAPMLLARPAWAQEASAPEASARSGELEEIVVTGTRKSRAEALQDVAVSVSAFTGSQIESSHIVNLVELGRRSPGVQLDTNGTFPASANFYIRGIGINTTNPSDDPTVGVFVDGIYQGVNIGALTDLFDLDSVEILRGPQGTLFGRNVTGGAVLVRTRRPSGEFQVRGELGYASFDDKSAKISIEAPIVKGALNGKIAILYRDRDGLFSNAANPRKRIAAMDNLIIRPVLEWKPNDGVTVTLIGEVGKQTDQGTPIKNLLIKAPAASITPPVPAGKFDLVTDFYTHTETQWRQVTGEAVFDVGSGRITANAGYRKLKVDNQAELDGTAAPLFHFVDPTGLRQEQLVGEIVYAGEIGSRIDLTVGANIFHQTIDYKEARVITSNTGRSTPSGRGLLNHTAGGVFAQADWRFIDRFTLTLGGRYTIERKHARVANFGQCNATVTVCNIGTDDSTSWRDFTPKAALKFQPTDDLTLYASYTRGFRSGGYNLRNSIGPAGPYDPENVDAYELGIKSEWLDRHVRANLSLYRNDFRNLQRQVLDDQARQRTINAASARIQGVEADLVVVPVDGLSLSGSLAYTDAKYGEYNGLDLTGDGIPDPALARNLKLTRVPKWVYSLAAAYETAIGSAGSINAQIAFDHTAERAGNDANTFFFAPYGLLSANLGFTTADRKYRISLYAKNLTNKIFYSSGTDIGTFRAAYLGAPRTIGVTFGFQF